MSETQINELFAGKIAESRQKLENGDDAGHNTLVNHIEVLLSDVRDLAYHDYLNDAHTLPKTMLIQYLELLIKNTKYGMYDN